MPVGLKTPLLTSYPIHLHQNHSPQNAQRAQRKDRETNMRQSTESLNFGLPGRLYSVDSVGSVVNRYCRVSQGKMMAFEFRLVTIALPVLF